MSRFLGEYNPNITEGSRIALPKKLRKYIRGREVVLARGFNKCIFVYDVKDWENLSQKRIENSKDLASTDALERYLYTSAVKTSVDSQGRIVIPVNLKEYAGVSNKTAVLGVGDRIEVWDHSEWQSYLKIVTEKLRDRDIV